MQGGATQLVQSLLALVRDSLTLVALLGYLLWLNWQLTLFVGVLFPAVALVMRALSRRLHRLTVQGQQATDELAYVVEENVLAWRIVRLHRRRRSAGRALRARQRDAAPAGAQGRGGRRHDDAADADARRLRAVGGDRRGAVAKRPAAAARWAASWPS